MRSVARKGAMAVTVIIFSTLTLLYFNEADARVHVQQVTTRLFTTKSFEMSRPEKASLCVAYSHQLIWASSFELCGSEAFWWLSWMVLLKVAVIAGCLLIKTSLVEVKT